MPRLIILGIVLCLCWLFLTNANAQVESKAYNTMLRTLLKHNVPEVSARTAALDSARTLFVDARERREYEVSHLNRAVWVGYDHFDDGALQQTDRNQKIVVYCSVGYRSERIAERLQAKGFTNVSNLYGGIFEWVNVGLPVYKAEQRTEAVHAYNRTWGMWLKRGKKVYE
jgi:rhodanese-related sulfurtransferase